jgi:hypothetical protein
LNSSLHLVLNLLVSYYLIPVVSLRVDFYPFLKRIHTIFSFVHVFRYSDYRYLIGFVFV